MNINLEQSKKAAQASGQALYERLHVLMPELYPDAWEDLTPKYQRAYTEVAHAPSQADERAALEEVGFVVQDEVHGWHFAPTVGWEYLGKGRTLYARSAPANETGAEEFTYASKQATACASCGEHKHTPLRIDWMGGYVCLTCIDRELESRAPAQAVEPVAQWQSRLKDRSSPVVDHWVNISPDGAKTLMEKYANVYEVRALYTAAHAPAQPSLPALTDAMRAVLTNDAGAYQSADELYAALCKAAGAESPDREDALAVLTDDHAFALYMLARTTDDSKRWIKELRTSLTASQEQEQPKPRECRHCGWMCIPNSTPSKTWYPLAHQEQPYEAITRVDTFLREYSKLRGIDQKRIHAVNGEHELRQDDLRAILNCAITHSGGISAKEEDRS